MTHNEIEAKAKEVAGFIKNNKEALAGFTMDEIMRAFLESRLDMINELEAEAKANPVGLFESATA